MTMGAANMSLTVCEAGIEVLLILLVVMSILSSLHNDAGVYLLTYVDFVCLRGRLILPSIMVLNAYINQHKTSVQSGRDIIILSSFDSDVCIYPKDICKSCRLYQPPVLLPAHSSRCLPTARLENPSKQHQRKLSSTSTTRQRVQWATKSESKIVFMRRETVRAVIVVLPVSKPVRSSQSRSSMDDGPS